MIGRRTALAELAARPPVEPKPAPVRRCCAIKGCRKWKQSTLGLCRDHENTFSPPKTTQERDRERVARLLARYPIGAFCVLPIGHPAKPRRTVTVDGKTFEVMYDGT